MFEYFFLKVLDKKTRKKKRGAISLIPKNIAALL